MRALYEWTPGSSSVRTVLRTEDRIADCQVRERTAFCLQEGATQPRRLVAVDLDRGVIRIVADPNPAFRSKAFPKIETILLADREGNPAYARIVYPYDYRPHGRYPLVITQYRSSGFLNGGLGDEYPIFPLAAEGYFVMDFDRPERTRLGRTADWEEMGRAYSMSGRALVLSALENGIDHLIGAGLIDETRIAITGLSGGAESVHYALQHSDRFAVGIASEAAHDITSFALVPRGATRDRLMRTFDMDGVVPSPGNPLLDIAWSQMPDKLTTPLLINVGQHEAFFGFEGIETLIQRQRPVEVRVFPDEFHIKYAPQTYAGIFENNLMWLRFWLKEEENADPAYAPQYARWRKMRAAKGVMGPDHGLVQPDVSKAPSSDR